MQEGQQLLLLCSFFSSPESKAGGELIGWQPLLSVIVLTPSLSVVVRCSPHFQTGMSLQHTSRSQPKFICSISLVGDFLHMHFRKID